MRANLALELEPEPFFDRIVIAQLPGGDDCAGRRGLSTAAQSAGERRRDVEGPDVGVRALAGVAVVLDVNVLEGDVVDRDPRWRRACTDAGGNIAATYIGVQAPTSSR